MLRLFWGFIYLFYCIGFLCYRKYCLMLVIVFSLWCDDRNLREVSILDKLTYEWVWYFVSHIKVIFLVIISKGTGLHEKCSFYRVGIVEVFMATIKWYISMNYDYNGFSSCLWWLHVVTVKYVMLYFFYFLLYQHVNFVIFLKVFKAHNICTLTVWLGKSSLSVL